MKFSLRRTQLDIWHRCLIGTCVWFTPPASYSVQHSYSYYSLFISESYTDANE